MISVGVDVNQAKNDDGSTPLHIACHKGHIEAVSYTHLTLPTKA